MKTGFFSTLLTGFMVVSAPFAAAASDKPIVAVFDVEVQRVKLDGSVIVAFTDYLVTKLTAIGAYQVVPRDQLKKRLRAQKSASYRKCFQESCQIEIGRELAANKSLATKIMKIGKECVVTATLYDLRKATTERAATAVGTCSEAGIMGTLKTAAIKLTESPKTKVTSSRAESKQAPATAKQPEKKPLNPGTPANDTPKSTASGLQGRVLQLHPRGHIIINVGTNHGVKRRQKGHFVKGGTTIGEFRVLAAKADKSYVRATSGKKAIVANPENIGVLIKVPKKQIFEADPNNPVTPQLTKDDLNVAARACKKKHNISRGSPSVTIALELKDDNTVKRAEVVGAHAGTPVGACVLRAVSKTRFSLPSYRRKYTYRL